MSVINGVDYDAIAEIAKTSRVPFHKLCSRAERGLPLEPGVQECDQWIGYTSAQKILSSRGLYSALTHAAAEIEYYGIRWKTKSKNKATSKRGCGVLFSKEDIIAVNDIRMACKLGLIASLKVFQAKKMGRL